MSIKIKNEKAAQGMNLYVFFDLKFFTDYHEVFASSSNA